MSRMHGSCSVVLLLMSSTKAGLGFLQFSCAGGTCSGWNPGSALMWFKVRTTAILQRPADGDKKKIVWPLRSIRKRASCRSRPLYHLLSEVSASPRLDYNGGINSTHRALGFGKRFSGKIVSQLKLVESFGMSHHQTTWRSKTQNEAAVPSRL